MVGSDGGAGGELVGSDDGGAGGDCDGGDSGFVGPTLGEDGGGD